MIEMKVELNTFYYGESTADKVDTYLMEMKRYYGQYSILTFLQNNLIQVPDIYEKIGLNNNVEVVSFYEAF
jgi:hypothetical protein